MVFPELGELLCRLFVAWPNREPFLETDEKPCEAKKGC